LYYNHLRLYTNLLSRLYALKERDVPTCSLLFVSTLVHFTLRVNDEYIDIEEDKDGECINVNYYTAMSHFWISLHTTQEEEQLVLIGHITLR
jgi:hypothetical protein